MPKKFKLVIEFYLTFDDDQTAQEVEDMMDRHMQKSLETIPELDDGFCSVISCELEK